MSGERDKLLDSWDDQHRRLATYEAAMALATDLLIEAVDVINPHQHPALHAGIRSFLLNSPVGGRL